MGLNIVLVAGCEENVKERRITAANDRITLPEPPRLSGFARKQKEVVRRRSLAPTILMPAHD